MFDTVGKCWREAVSGRNLLPVTSTSTKLSSKNAILLDYIISHAQGDQRPYLRVEILGFPILGLLDSGATNTVVGQSGIDILLSLGLKLNKASEANDCMVANGQTVRCIGIFRTPICLMGKVKIFNILAVPSVAHNLILGHDFWISMEIMPDLRRDVWEFASKPKSLECCAIESRLNVAQNQELTQLIKEKFERMGSGLGFTHLTEHEILVDSAPIKQRYYPVSPFKQKVIDDELNKMLEQGIVEPSASAWSSPILLVPKKEPGQYRFCVDYRKVNAVTKKDAYPLPYISSILDKLRDGKYISSIDIRSAYHQVGIAKGSREYTAFTIPSRGLFQFKRMPFGLTNAPATFQRLIDRVVGYDLEPHVFAYLDDIVILTSTFEQHLIILTKVLDRLIEAGLTLNREKCHFCMSELRYLGFIVDERGLRCDPSKVSAILDIPSPKNVHEVRRFVGMSAWYRRFVPDFSTIVAPLTNLTKKNVKFDWSNGCELAFNTLKEKLVSSPVLNVPDFSQHFYLQTDASGFGLGAVLFQKIDGQERVICYLSRSLTKAERILSTTERECLSVIWAVEKLRHYLEGVKFTVITDHWALLWLNRLKDPTGRLGRWALRLQIFDFDIVHRKGCENVVPDCLSRSVPVIDALEIQKLDFSNTTDRWYKKMENKILLYPENFPQWRFDKDILYKYVKPPSVVVMDDSSNWKIVVPKDFRLALLKKFHDGVLGGHLGIFKTYWKLRDQFTWPKMKADVASYIRRCLVCAEHKPEQKAPAGQMGNIPNIKYPWQMLSLDFVGPLPRSTSGHKYILSVTDYFSKYVLFFPIRTANSKTLTRIIEEEVFLVYGVPQFLGSDNGKQMISHDFKKLAQKYKVHLFNTAYYHARSNPTERYNKTIKTMVSCYVEQDQRKWSENLSSLSCALRTAKSEVTGYSPFYVNFGRNFMYSGDQHFSKSDDFVNKQDVYDCKTRIIKFSKMFAQIKEKIARARERNKKVFNKGRRDISFEIGQKVYRRNKVLSSAANYFNAKLAKKFVGPFVVKDRKGTCTYELADERGRSKGLWHVQDLKPYVECSDSSDSDPNTD